MAGREGFDWLVGWRGVQHTICGLAHTEAGENLNWRQTGGGGAGGSYMCAGGSEWEQGCHHHQHQVRPAQGARRARARRTGHKGEVSEAHCRNRGRRIAETRVCATAPRRQGGR